LYKKELVARDFNFQVDFEKISKMEGITAKIRYASKPAKVKIEKCELLNSEKISLEQTKCESLYMLHDNKGIQEAPYYYKIIFEEPQRAITKGQSVVLYKNNILLGGGIIA